MIDKVKWKKMVIDEFEDEIKENEAYFIPIYNIQGCRGRKIQVFEDRVIISTDVTLGSILTANATDGDKTIFFHDVVGIQYKKPGLTIGYLQLETASGQMNNIASNQFGENTFTYEKLTEEITQMTRFIQWKVSKYKRLNKEEFYNSELRLELVEKRKNELLAEKQRLKAKEEQQKKKEELAAIKENEERINKEREKFEELKQSGNLKGRQLCSNCGRIIVWNPRGCNFCGAKIEKEEN